MKFVITLTIALFLSSICRAQGKYYCGLLMNDEAYDSIPQKVELLTRDYTNLPSRASLKPYCPTPGDQGQYGTCTSWSTTYGARTICEAYRNNWTERYKINAEAFAPIFVYAQIELYGRRDCQNGTYIQDAFKVLKEKGAPKLSHFNYLCACESHIPYDVWSSAKNYRITDYTTLFSSASTDRNQKIRSVKKALAEHCPVVISYSVSRSFYNARGVWNGYRDSNDGGHAMCVIGYDDNMYGGAFEIMNSWGTDWGNDGFIWMRYSDFASNVRYAMEMFVNDGYSPTKSTTLSGTMRLQLSTGEDIRPSLKQSSVPYYSMEGSYNTGTRYRLYISNGQPCYVYILGSDDYTGDVSVVFPSNPKISPILAYSGSNIAIPHEDQFIQMDATPGLSYLCVLYSSTALDINSLARIIQGQSGSFAEKVRKGLSDKMVPVNLINSQTGAIHFSTSSTAQVVPVVMAINHK